MTNRHYRSCYTNRTRNEGGVVISGWTSLGVSPELSQESLDFCLSKQSKNNTGSNDLLPGIIEEGHWEVYYEQGQVFYIHNQYGLVDYRNRFNYFSHAIIFPDGKDVLASPNSFLALSRDTFARSEEEMESKDELIYGETWTDEAAFQVTGLDQTRYEKLLQAVYSYIQSDDYFDPLYLSAANDEQRKALLYLIYTGLPLSCRSLISVSSHPTSTTRSLKLVFHQDANSERYYFDTALGKTSLDIDEELTENVPSLKTIGHVSEKQREDYFKELAQIGERFDLATSTEEVALRFLHLLVQAEPQDELAILQACLRIRKRSLALDDYLAKSLKDYLAKGGEMTQYDENFLNRCQQGTQSPALKEFIFQYRVNLLLRLEHAQAVQVLKEFEGEERKKAIAYLQADKSGVRLYETYLLSYYKENSPKTLSGWQFFLDEIADLPKPPSILSIWSKKARECYVTEIQSQVGKLSAYKTYLGILEELHQKEDKLLEAMNMLVQSIDIDHLQLDQKMQELLMEPIRHSSWKYYQLIKADIDEGIASKKFHEICNLLRDRKRLVEDFSRELPFSSEQFVNAYLRHIDLPKIDKDWICYMLNIDDSECYQQMLDLQASLDQKQWDELQEAYRVLADKDALLSTLKDMVLSVLVEIDQHTQVPLDVWLLVCEGEIESLLELSLSIFQNSTDELLKNSRLIHEEEHQRLLQTYVQKRGKYYQKVRKLLKQATKTESSNFGKGLLQKILPFGSSKGHRRER